MPTPLQNVRVPDRLWEAARERAVRNGSNVSAVVRRALLEYVRDDVHEPCGRTYRDHGPGALTCPAAGD